MLTSVILDAYPAPPCLGPLQTALSAPQPGSSVALIVSAVAGKGAAAAAAAAPPTAAAGLVQCTRPGALAALQVGNWQQLSERRCTPHPQVASCTKDMGWQWAWAAEPPPCGARQFSDAELRRQLAGKSVLLLGDSHTRAMFTYLTRTLNGGCGGWWEPSWLVRRGVSSWHWLGCTPLRWRRPPPLRSTAASRPSALRHASPSGAAPRAGTFSSAIDVFSKGWNSDSWHGNSSSGARAAGPAAADLHVQLLWHTAVPQVRDVLKQM